jgi:hypothetical protein
MSKELRKILTIAIVGAILAVLVDHFLKPGLTKNVKATLRVP